MRSKIFIFLDVEGVAKKFTNMVLYTGEFVLIFQAYCAHQEAIAALASFSFLLKLNSMFQLVFLPAGCLARPFARVTVFFQLARHHRRYYWRHRFRQA
jgi:hypothetical protein